MNRLDDLTLAGDLLVYRRIPNCGDQTVWPEGGGDPYPATQNFSDRRNEWSANLACETTPEKMLENYPDFGLVQLTLAQIRQAYADAGRPLIICRDPDEPSDGHVLVCGKASPSIKNKLRAVAAWVPGKLPKRPIPF